MATTTKSPVKRTDAKLSSTPDKRRLVTPKETLPPSLNSSHIASPTTKSTKSPASPKNLSALAAAAKVLGESTTALSTGEMIAQMAAKGYWTSPCGKTPAATLYSAILRELKKGDASRFAKAEPGKFSLKK